MLSMSLFWFVIWRMALKMLKILEKVCEDAQNFLLGFSVFSVTSGAKISHLNNFLLPHLCR